MGAYEGHWESQKLRGQKDSSPEIADGTFPRSLFSHTAKLLQGIQIPILLDNVCLQLHPHPTHGGSNPKAPIETREEDQIDIDALNGICGSGG